MKMSTNLDFQLIVLLITFWGAIELFVPCLTQLNASCGLVILPTLDMAFYESNYNNFMAKPFHRLRVPFNETQLVGKLWSFHCGVVPAAGGILNNSVTPVPAPEKSFQWTVALNTKSTKMCSGVMLSDRWVLTTAECAAPRVDELYLGVNKAGGFDSKVAVDKTILHNDYNNLTKENNIALLRLNPRVFITENIRPACFPTKELDLSTAQCFISGFQNISATFALRTLKYVPAYILPLEVCSYAFKLNKRLVDVRNVCADVKWRQSCYANLGSPLTCVIKDRHYVAGVFYTSQGKCTNFAEPLVFTSLTAYSHWIYRIVDYY